MALTGNVSRWFNRKGFGFINVVNSDSGHVGQDLFVHLSGINVSGDGYKCLYPGEYVSFDLGSGKDGRPICENVTGVMGGSLLCEHAEYRFKYFQKDPRRDEGQVSDDRVSDDRVSDPPQTETSQPDQVDDQVDENDPCQHS